MNCLHSHLTKQGTKQGTDYCAARDVFRPKGGRKLAGGRASLPREGCKPFYAAQRANTTGSCRPKNHARRQGRGKMRAQSFRRPIRGGCRFVAVDPVVFASA
jgi:hypothetical protein